MDQKYLATALVADVRFISVIGILTGEAADISARADGVVASRDV